MTSSSEKWEHRRLGQLVHISKGKKHSETFESQCKGSHRYIQIEDLRGDAHMKYTLGDGVHASQNDILVAWDGANAGTVGFGLEGYIGSTIAKLKPVVTTLDPSFLGRFLRSKSSLIRSRCTGATIPHVSKSYLESVRVPIPPLSVQRRIAAVLAKSDAAREKRRQANQLTEKFLQSVFLEMFGDPVTNPRGWKKASLVDLCVENGDLRCGPFGSQLKKEHYQSEGVPVWDIEDVKAEFKNPPRFHISPGKAKDLSNYYLQPGDIVVTRRATIGISAVYPLSVGRGVMHSALLRIRVDQRKADPVFLSNQLSKSKDVEDQISRFSTGAIFKSINVSKLKSVQILLPPLSEQLRYNVLVKNVDSLRAKQRESEKELDNLFSSLMQQAFRGELVG